MQWIDLPHAPQAGDVLCDWSDVPDGGVKMLTLGGAEGGVSTAMRLLVLKSGDAVRVYVNRCAHFGVPLAAKPEHLIFEPHRTLTCNVHYARYRWSDGLCTEGDCEGETLLAVPAHINALGQVVVGH